MIIYADRKIWAAMALRRGPNVVGPFGLLQTFADGLKVFLKETIIPSGANKRPVPDRADHHLHRRADRLGGDAVRRRAGARRHQCRAALHPRGQLARRLRHHHVGLGVELEISVLRGAARGGADGQLRGLDRLRPRSRVVLYVGSFNLSDIVAGAEGHGASASSTASSSIRCCSRWRWCSSSRRWPRPTARRST